MEKSLQEDKVKRYRVSGTAESEWVALDFVDVVVHIFSTDARSFYDLENLWNDAGHVEMAS